MLTWVINAYRSIDNYFPRLLVCSYVYFIVIGTGDTVSFLYYFEVWLKQLTQSKLNAAACLSISKHISPVSKVKTLKMVHRVRHINLPITCWKGAKNKFPRPTLIASAPTNNSRLGLPQTLLITARRELVCEQIYLTRRNYAAGLRVGLLRDGYFYCARRPNEMRARERYRRLIGVTWRVIIIREREEEGAVRGGTCSLSTEQCKFGCQDHNSTGGSSCALHGACDTEPAPAQYY